MTKITLNPAFEAFRGKMAGIVFRMRYGKQTGSKAPDMRNVQWSAAQQEHRKRFKLAVTYAHAAMADEQVRAQYAEEAKRNGPYKRPFDLAVSDYFKGRDLLTGH